MIYTKIKTGDKIENIPADNLEFFCICPECAKETAAPLFELIESGFDASDSVLCDECQEKANAYRERLSTMDINYGIMPMDKLREAFQLLIPYERMK